MGKLKIKFWSKINMEYVNDNHQLYFVNSKGFVVRHIGGGDISFTESIEPHFYLNGERVA